MHKLNLRTTKSRSMLVSDGPTDADADRDDHVQARGIA